MSEIKRLMMKKSLYGAVLIGIIAGCMGLITYSDNVYFHRAVGNEEAISAFDAWLYAIAVSPSSLLKLVIPILIAIPFTDSYVYDKKSGYINFIRTRTGYIKYFLSKLIVNGMAGAIVIFVIYMALLIICGFLYPFNTPNTNLNYMPNGFFENIYKESPFLYIPIVTLIGCLFGIVFTTLGLSASAFINNRFAVAAYPFIFYLFFVIFGQITRMEFLIPVILNTPFTIIGVHLSDIILGYTFVLLIVSLQLILLYRKDNRETF